MVPQTKPPRDFGTVCQWVNHSCVSRSGSSYDQNRNAALRTVGGYYVVQRVRFHTSGPVSPHETQRRTTYTRLMRDFEPSKVAFLRRVENR
jgi:hypothetical protein